MHDIEFDLSISLNVKLNDIHVIRLSIYIFLIKYNSDNHYAYLAIVCLLQPLEKSIIILPKFRPSVTSVITKDHKSVTSKIHVACPKKDTRNIDCFPLFWSSCGDVCITAVCFPWKLCFCHGCHLALEGLPNTPHSIEEHQCHNVLHIAVTWRPAHFVCLAGHNPLNYANCCTHINLTFEHSSLPQRTSETLYGILLVLMGIYMP